MKFSLHTSDGPLPWFVLEKEEYNHFVDLETYPQLLPKKKKW